eukprot:2608057-Pyramimonas_sp.AAC.1
MHANPDFLNTSNICAEVYLAPCHNGRTDHQLEVPLHGCELSATSLQSPPSPKARTTDGPCARATDLQPWLSKRSCRHLLRGRLRKTKPTLPSTASA